MTQMAFTWRTAPAVRAEGDCEEVVRLALVQLARLAEAFANAASC
jgi:hypothetical protein